MITNKNIKGFTIIELLIVIVIIAILATIGVVAYGGVQENARNSKRDSDISSLHTGFEATFIQTGAYPNLAQANDTALDQDGNAYRATHLKGIPSDAYTDPKAADDQMAAAPAASVYSYEVLPAGCDDVAGNECVSYTLTATKEGGEDPIVKTSLN